MMLTIPARLSLLALIAGLSPLHASAQEAAKGATAPEQQASDASPDHAEAGAVTRRWLQAQGTREQASAAQPTLSGPVMRRVHERYVKSFEQPIPEKLADERPLSHGK